MNRKLFGAVALALLWASAATPLLLAACSQSKTYAVSEESDDRVCRGHVKNCTAGKACSTYEECRKELVDFANHPVGAVPAAGSVSVPAGSTVVIVPR